MQSLGDRVRHAVYGDGVVHGVLCGRSLFVEFDGDSTQYREVAMNEVVSPEDRAQDPIYCIPGFPAIYSNKVIR